MITITCPRCYGDAGEYLSEDAGVHEWHACYHCGETGTITLTDDEYVSMVNELLDEATAQER